MSPLRPTLAIVVCFALSDSALSAQWNLIWAPEANKDGLHAFEGIEDNGSNQGPQKGVKRIYVEGNNYRFDMFADDVNNDNQTYKQRTEVRGMKANGQNQYFHKGETWKVTFQMFMPNSLKGTEGFNTVTQVKQSGVDAALYDMGIMHRNGGEEFRAKIDGTNGEFFHTDVTPLRNKWVDVEFNIRVDDAPHGFVNISISDGSKVYSGHRTNADTFYKGTHSFTQSRPKWGIYRSKSYKPAIIDTYILFTKFRAYRYE